MYSTSCRLRMAVKYCREFPLKDPHFQTAVRLRFRLRVPRLITESRCTTCIRGRQYLRICNTTHCDTVVAVPEWCQYRYINHCLSNSARILFLLLPQMAERVRNALVEVLGEDAGCSFLLRSLGYTNARSLRKATRAGLCHLHLIDVTSTTSCMPEVSSEREGRGGEFPTSVYLPSPCIHGPNPHSWPPSSLPTTAPLLSALR